jgi:hypothetical protein
MILPRREFHTRNRDNPVSRVAVKKIPKMNGGKNKNNTFVCVSHAIYKINLYPGSFRDENQKSLRFKNASDTDGKKEGKSGQRGRNPQIVLYFL